MSFFVVRNNSGKYYLGTARGGMGPLRNAQRFATKEEAAEWAVFEGEHVCEISYVLAWYAKDKRERDVMFPYMTTDGNPHGPIHRFETREAACAWIPRSWAYPTDFRDGWKVVALRKVCK